MRIGFGYDSHRFDEARECVLGGISIPGAPGLAGFSDGDAVAHAVTDAILGAASLGDIGGHFPPGDDKWRNADSLRMLQQAVSLVHQSGYEVGNVDVTVVCEIPAIAPVAAQMRRALAAALDVAPDRVSVKGKSNEGMGWVGEREGLAAYAVALLVPRS
jgi:2-C-methyl-D-erythritol 2,4-cyclodiphosphate synthase